MIELKLESLNGEVGVILPTEVLARLGVRDGDSLWASATDEGFLLRALAEQVEAEGHL